jgi:hypothetical protein
LYKNAGAEFDPEEDEPTLEAAWPHLQLVYEFFLRSHNFLLHLILVPIVCVIQPFKFLKGFKSALMMLMTTLETMARQYNSSRGILQHIFNF